MRPAGPLVGLTGSFAGGAVEGGDAPSEVNKCHFVTLLWAAGWQFALQGRLSPAGRNAKEKKEQTPR